MMRRATQEYFLLAKSFIGLFRWSKHASNDHVTLNLIFAAKCGVAERLTSHWWDNLNAADFIVKYIFIGHKNLTLHVQLLECYLMRFSTM